MQNLDHWTCYTAQMQITHVTSIMWLCCSTQIYMLNETCPQLLSRHFSSFRTIATLSSTRSALPRRAYKFFHGTLGQFVGTCPWNLHPQMWRDESNTSRTLGGDQPCGKSNASLVGPWTKDASETNSAPPTIGRRQNAICTTMWFLWPHFPAFWHVWCDWKRSMQYPMPSSKLPEHAHSTSAQVAIVKRPTWSSTM